ncbi:MAG: glycosyltransferase family 25 protein [Cytophagaceae bacterium]|nr:MAG: glycosyltransferase family 25 protein [Cytophagaceae bacterium]
MRTFVINLERSTMRREFMHKQLTAQDIDFTFTKAVDGATLTDDYLNQVCDFQALAQRPYLLKKGVYGCLLSHYNVYQEIVEKGLPCALVLEDDVVIEPGLKVLLDAIEKTIQGNEVVLLFTQNNYMPTILSSQQVENLTDNYKLHYPMDVWAFGSAAGYIISQAAAKSMLNYLLPIRYAADTWGAFYTEQAIDSIRCVTPFILKPAGFKSDIDYIDASSMKGKVTKFINDNNIFLLKKLLTYRRNYQLNKTVTYSFTPEPSPMLTK